MHAAYMSREESRLLFLERKIAEIRIVVSLKAFDLWGWGGLTCCVLGTRCLHNLPEWGGAQLCRSMYAGRVSFTTTISYFNLRGIRLCNEEMLTDE